MNLKLVSAIVASVILSYGCGKENMGDDFKPLGSEPAAKLVLETKWGDGKGELGRSADVWTPSFEYYFVRGNEVFIADQTVMQVKYYRNGRYVRDYDYSYTHSRLYGMVVMNDILYLFVDLDGALGISLEDGKIRYSRGFPFLPEQNHYYVYQYEKSLIISENASGKGTLVKMCLSPELQQQQCPDFVVPNESYLWSPYQYLSRDQIAFFYALRNGESTTPRIIYTDKGMHRAQAVVYPRDQIDYDMRGLYLIAGDGIYYPVHTKNAAQIWFKPWWSGASTGEARARR